MIYYHLPKLPSPNYYIKAYLVQGTSHWFYLLLQIIYHSSIFFLKILWHNIELAWNQRVTWKTSDSKMKFGFLALSDWSFKLHLLLSDDLMFLYNV